MKRYELKSTTKLKRDEHKHTTSKANHQTTKEQTKIR